MMVLFCHLNLSANNTFCATLTSNNIRKYSRFQEVDQIILLVFHLIFCFLVTSLLQQQLNLQKMSTPNNTFWNQVTGVKTWF